MSRKDNDLYVMVKVDLTRFPLPFEIYQIQNLLHTVNEGFRLFYQIGTR